MMRRIFSSLVFGAMLLPCAVARADPAAAEALFREGRRLMSEGQLTEACEKFAASQKLDPASGTLLNLADCQLKAGKLATAWATFVSAGTLAKSEGKALRVTEAQRRASELEPRLPYLLLRITSRPAGLVIRRDNVIIDDAALDMKVPVDPGAHTVTAAAPGHDDWSSTVTLTEPGVTELSIPTLLEQQPAGAGAPAEAPPASAVATPPPPLPPPPPQSPSGRSLLPGLAVGGAGLILVGMGAYFGVSSGSSYSEAEARCPSHKGCPESARDPSDAASRYSTLATVGVGLGVAGLATGAALILFSSPKKTGSWHLAPGLARRSGGLLVEGSF